MLGLLSGLTRWLSGTREISVHYPGVQYSEVIITQKVTDNRLLPKNHRLHRHIRLLKICFLYNLANSHQSYHKDSRKFSVMQLDKKWINHRTLLNNTTAISPTKLRTITTSLEYPKTIYLSHWWIYSGSLRQIGKIYSNCSIPRHISTAVNLYRTSGIEKRHEKGFITGSSYTDSGYCWFCVVVLPWTHAICTVIYQCTMTIAQFIIHHMQTFDTGIKNS